MHLFRSARSIWIFLALAIATASSAVTVELPFSSRQITNSLDGAFGIAFADADGDGDLDAFGTSRSQDDLVLFLHLDGDGTDWIASLIDPALTFLQTARPLEAA